MSGFRILVWSCLAAFVAVQVSWSTSVLQDHPATPLRVGLYVLDLAVLVVGGLLVAAKIISDERRRRE